MARDQEFIEKAILAKIIADAWKSDEFKNRLVSDAATVLRERGIAVPTDLTISVLEDTATTLHMILPAKPEVSRISELDHPEQFIAIYTFTQLGGGYGGSGGSGGGGGGGGGHGSPHGDPN
ncbi:MAG: hypothetical protein JWM41_4250 [Gemmatimonadetes bacterium]|nr:hypothetical protein [Gemmatimonadota bacterium]